MKHLTFFFIIFLAVFIFGCKNLAKITFDDEAEFEYEIQVLNEIFVDLTKEMGVQFGYPKHPPPPSFRNKEGEQIEVDSSIYFKQMKKYRIDTANFSIAPQSISLAISDYLHEMSDEEFLLNNNLLSSKYNSVLKHKNKRIKSSKKIVLDSLTNTGIYNLKYRSEFKADLDKFYFNLYINNVYGVLNCSRIYFNRNKTKGIFKCDYYLENLNAHGGYVFIRKVNDIWEVEKYLNHWIS
jgi:hypothetical protein